MEKKKFPSFALIIGLMKGLAPAILIPIVWIIWLMIKISNRHGELPHYPEVRIVLFSIIPLAVILFALWTMSGNRDGGDFPLDVDHPDFFGKIYLLKIDRKHDHGINWVYQIGNGIGLFITTSYLVAMVIRLTTI